MKNITYLLLLIIFTISTTGSAQNIKHISQILTTYQTSLVEIESQLIAIKYDSLATNSTLKKTISNLKKLQVQKFNLDSAFIEYEFMSKQILLDKILTKKKLKKKLRTELKKELLKWNYRSCHPKSDQLWHSVSRFFYDLETITNTPYLNRNSLLSLAQDIKKQQRIISIMLKDIIPF